MRSRNALARRRVLLVVVMLLAALMGFSFGNEDANAHPGGEVPAATAPLHSR